MNNPQRTSLLMPPTAHLAPSARRYRRLLKQRLSGGTCIIRSSFSCSEFTSLGKRHDRVTRPVYVTEGTCGNHYGGTWKIRWSISSKVENKGLSDRSGSMRSFREYRRTWLCGKHQVRQNASHLYEIRKLEVR